MKWDWLIYTVLLVVEVAYLWWFFRNQGRDNRRRAAIARIMDWE